MIFYLLSTKWGYCYLPYEQQYPSLLTFGPGRRESSPVCLRSSVGTWVGRGHWQVYVLGFMTGVSSNILKDWNLTVFFCFLSFICLVLQQCLDENTEEDRLWLSSWQWNNRWVGTCSHSWIYPSFANWAGFSSCPGSSKCTWAILVPVTFH